MSAMIKLKCPKCDKIHNCEWMDGELSDNSSLICGSCGYVGLYKQFTLTRKDRLEHLLWTEGFTLDQCYKYAKRIDKLLQKWDKVR